MLSTWDGQALGHVGAKEDGQSWEVRSWRGQTWVSVGLSRRDAMVEPTDMFKFVSSREMPKKA